jgi:RNA recognition motif-containing protein
VRNLPSDVTAAEIEEEFKHFGRIKPDGVFVRNRKVNLLSSPLYWHVMFTVAEIAIDSCRMLLVFAMLLLSLKIF